jgi:hypothetical protein
MPGTIISSPLPVVGATASPTWATQILTWCNEVQADLEAAIVPSEITINADVEFNGYKVTELKGTKFNSLAASAASVGASGANTLEVVAGDLRFCDGSGRSIQLTLGGSLNVSTAGGIAGDYIGTTASVSYSAANDLYTFSDDSSPGRPARMNCGQVQIREEVAGSETVTLKSPADLASSYSIVFPAVPVAGQNFLLATEAGGTVTLETGRTLTSQCNFLGGATFKASGAGSTPILHFEQKGTRSEAVGGLETLGGTGWTPVVTHAGVAAETNGLINYVNRYAYVQRINNWVMANARIDFYCTWDAGTHYTSYPASVVERHEPFIVTGMPYAAYSDTALPGDYRVTAWGNAFEFPQNEWGTSPVTGESNNIGPIICHMRAGETDVRFSPVWNAKTSSQGACRPTQPVEYQATGWGISGQHVDSQERIKLWRETDTTDAPLNLNYIYTISFQIHFRTGSAI